MAKSKKKLHPLYDLDSLIKTFTAHIKVCEKSQMYREEEFLLPASLLSLCNEIKSINKRIEALDMQIDQIEGRDY